MAKRLRWKKAERLPEDLGGENLWESGNSDDGGVRAEMARRVRMVKGARIVVET